MPVVRGTLNRPPVGSAVTDGSVVIELVGENGKRVRGFLGGGVEVVGVHRPLIDEEGTWEVDVPANELIEPLGTMWKYTRRVDDVTHIDYGIVEDGAGPYDFEETLEDGPPGALNSPPLQRHIDDTDDAHDATAISAIPAGGLAGTTAQAQLYELDTEKATTVALSAAIAQEVIDRDAAIAAAEAGLLDLRGNYDASTNLFPAAGGSGAAGAVTKADLWIASVAGTLGGTAVKVGDFIIAKVDAPGQTAGNWSLIENDFGFTPENTANKSIDGAFAANSDTLFPSQKAAKTYVDAEAARALAAEALLIPLAQKAALSGVATLDETGRIPEEQLQTLGFRLIGLEYESYHFATAGDFASIQTQIDAAAALGATAAERRLVLVPAGTYSGGTSHIEAAEGVDVSGLTGDPDDVIVTSASTGANISTVQMGGRNTLWAHLTIDHTGPVTEYGVHADTLGINGSEKVLLNCKVSSQSKAAMGSGTRNGESIFAYGCEFRSKNTIGAAAQGFLAHNVHAADVKSYIVLVDCLCVAEGAGAGDTGVQYTEYNSTRADELWVVGGTVTGAAGQADIEIAEGEAGASNVYYFDPAAYSTISAGGTSAARVFPTTGLTPPTPIRRPRWDDYEPDAEPVIQPNTDPIFIPAPAMLTLAGTIGDAVLGSVTPYSAFDIVEAKTIVRAMPDDWTTYDVDVLWFFNSISRTITNKALTSNVATLTTSAAHGYVVGAPVTVAGVDATFDGTYTITAVPTSTTFSYAKVAANVASVASAGTANTNTGNATFRYGKKTFTEGVLASSGSDYVSPEVPWPAGGVASTYTKTRVASDVVSAPVVIHNIWRRAGSGATLDTLTPSVVGMLGILLTKAS